MDELEATVQKHVICFCKILPIHVEKWETLLQDATKPVEAFSNYAEQLRHVQKANIKYLEDFLNIQKNLEFKICQEMEYEISILKELVDELNSVNHNTRNKLSQLERSTIGLNWENDSLLITGSALQPPLSRILQDGWNFWLFFSDAMKNINNQLKNINVTDKKSMDALENAFKIYLKDEVVINLLALTQYVNNEKLLN